MGRKRNTMREYLEATREVALDRLDVAMAEAQLVREQLQKINASLEDLDQLDLKFGTEEP